MTRSRKRLLVGALVVTATLGAVAGPALFAHQGVTLAGTVAQADRAASPQQAPNEPKVEIKLARTSLTVDEVRLSDTWLPGCQPGPGCTKAKAGESFLCISLTAEAKDQSEVGNLNKGTETAYVVTPEGAKAKRWNFGFSVDRAGRVTYLLGFKVRSTGGDFTLFWPDGQSYKLAARLLK